MNKFKLRAQISNALIILPLLISCYFIYPIVWTEFKYQTQTQNLTATETPVSSKFGIVIPKLGINEQIIAQVDPFNKSEYMTALNQGVAHAKGSSTPDLGGFMYLFAHSSDNPFALTRYNTAFYLLPKLKNNDLIQIYYQGKKYDYLVYDQQVVKPSQVEFLTQNTSNDLILQTCTPAGTSLNRLLVFAKPVASN